MTEETDTVQDQDLDQEIDIEDQETEATLLEEDDKDLKELL